MPPIDRWCSDIVIKELFNFQVTSVVILSVVGKPRLYEHERLRGDPANKDTLELVVMDGVGTGTAKEEIV